MKQNNTVQTGFKFLVIALVTLSLQVVSNSCTTSNFSKEAGSENLILVCGDSKVLLVDYANSKDSIPEIVWSWDAHLAQDLPEEYKSNLLFLNGHRQIGIICLSKNNRQK